jgi:predicted O-methyltransferase YrrM
MTFYIATCTGDATMDAQQKACKSPGNLRNICLHYRFLDGMHMSYFRAFESLPRKINDYADKITSLAYLLTTRAPTEVLMRAVLGGIELPHPTRVYAVPSRAYSEQMANLTTTTDWFSSNIPFWLWLFDKYKLSSRESVRALEIGSWEGVSSWFLLTALPNTTLFCVDTWEGADEHKTGLEVDKKVLAQIEQNFIANMAPFGSRVAAYKGKSIEFFASHPQVELFDLIYVDGSHFSDDVLIDALNSFNILKVGGVIIFDDYLWRLHERPENNPASAINAFLRLKRSQYRIVRVYHQLIVEKTAKNSRKVAERKAF